MKMYKYLLEIVIVLTLLVSFLIGYFLGFKTSQKASDTILEEPVYKLLDRIYNVEE